MREPLAISAAISVEVRGGGGDEQTSTSRKGESTGVDYPDMLTSRYCLAPYVTQDQD